MKKTKRAILLISLLLIVSCSSLSPFRGKGYSTFASAFGGSGELVVLIDTEKFDITSYVNSPELRERSEYLTLVREPDGSIIGALEGAYPADVIRYATGKNRNVFGKYSVMQPDSGIFLFTDASLDDAYELSFKNRKVVTTESELKERFKNALSIYGHDVRGLIGDELNDIVFNKIDININKNNIYVNKNDKSVNNDTGFVLSGTVTIDDEGAFKRFLTYFKTWYIGDVRRSGGKVDLNRIDESIKVGDDQNTLIFTNLPWYSLNLRANSLS